MSNVKLVLTILRDRIDLSQQNNWVDKHTDIYFIYTNQDLMSILNIANTSILNKVKKELLEVKLLEKRYGGNLLHILKNYSKGYFNLFNQFVQAIEYVTKSAEQEMF